MADRIGLVMVRVSTKQQAEKGFSIPSQIRWAVKKAKSMDIKLPIEPIELKGVSGKTFPTEWEEVDKHIQEDNITDILTIELDRIGRDSLENIYFISRILKKGITIITKEKDYTEKFEDKLIASFKSLIAEHELNQITERTQRGKKEKFRSKKWVLGRVPFGYKKEDEWPVKVTSDIKVVQNLYKEFEKIQTIAKVTRTINERYGKNFTSAKVRAILKNPIYMGRPKYSEIEVQDPTLAMVIEKTFSNVQNIFENKTIKKKEHKSEKHAESLLKEYGLGYAMRCNPNLVLICEKCYSIMVKNGGKIIAGYRVQNYLCKTCGHQTPLFTGARLNNYRKLNLMSCPYCRETESFDFELTESNMYFYNCRECGGSFWSKANPNKYLRKIPMDNLAEDIVKVRESEVKFLCKQEPLANWFSKTG